MTANCFGDDPIDRELERKVDQMLDPDFGDLKEIIEKEQEDK